MRRASHEEQGPWRRWFSVVFLVAFVASSALGGFSFVWCLGMQQAKMSCCCHVTPDPADTTIAVDDGGPTLDRQGCCETRRFDAAENFQSPRDPAPAIAAAPVAVLPAPALAPAVTARTVEIAKTELPVPMGRAPPLIAVYLRTSRLHC